MGGVPAQPRCLWGASAIGVGLGATFRTAAASVATTAKSRVRARQMAWATMGWKCRPLPRAHTGTLRVEQFPKILLL